MLQSTIGGLRRFELQWIAEQTDDSRHTTLKARFECNGTIVDLDVEDDQRWGANDDDLAKDNDGNEYAWHTFTVKLNHPSHGSVSPMELIAHCKLWNDVALLACEIEAELLVRTRTYGSGRVYSLVRTPAQRLEHEAAAATRVVEAKKEQDRENAKTVMQNNCHHMRIGSEKTLTTESVAGIPDGWYTANFGCKWYTLIVTSGVGATLTRTM